MVRDHFTPLVDLFSWQRGRAHQHNLGCVQKVFGYKWKLYHHLEVQTSHCTVAMYWCTDYTYLWVMHYSTYWVFCNINLLSWNSTLLIKRHVCCMICCDAVSFHTSALHACCLLGNKVIVCAMMAIFVYVFILGVDHRREEVASWPSGAFGGMAS